MKKTGIAWCVLFAGFTCSSLKATAISFDITGQVVSTGFTDTYGYFGGGGFAGGTAVSMSVSYDTASCSYSGSAGFEILYPCGTGAITDSLTLGGYTYTDSSVSGNFAEMYQEMDAPDSEFAYYTGDGTAIQISVYSTNAYQSGAILNGPPSNLDQTSPPIEQAYVCVSGNCDFIAFSNAEVTGASTPEPGPLFLLGSGLTALALLRFRKLRA